MPSLNQIPYPLYNPSMQGLRMEHLATSSMESLALLFCPSATGTFIIWKGNTIEQPMDLLSLQSLQKTPRFGKEPRLHCLTPCSIQTLHKFRNSSWVSLCSSLLHFFSSCWINESFLPIYIYIYRERERESRIVFAWISLVHKHKHSVIPKKTHILHLQISLCLFY